MGARVPPAAIFAIALAGQRAVTRRSRGTVGSALAGAALAGASAALLLGSVRAFAARGTTVAPHRPDSASALVTDGPNAVTRNPMYLGMLGLLLASAISRPRLAALLPTFGFWWAVDRCQIPAEEQALAERFAQDYEDYCRRVPRWL